MVKPIFLSIKYLTDNTPINTNVDAKELYKYAWVAQETMIQEVIGTKLYDYLKGVVEDSEASPPTSISSDNQTLLEAIRDALVWATLYKALPFISTKIRNIGTVKQAGDNITNASASEDAALRKEIMDNFTAYTNKVKRYLCEYDSLYSEFKCDSWNLNPNLITKLNCGIAFEKSNRDINYELIKKWFNS